MFEKISLFLNPPCFLPVGRLEWFSGWFISCIPIIRQPGHVLIYKWHISNTLGHLRSGGSARIPGTTDQENYIQMKLRLSSKGHHSDLQTPS